MSLQLDTHRPPRVPHVPMAAGTLWRRQLVAQAPRGDDTVWRRQEARPVRRLPMPGLSLPQRPLSLGCDSVAAGAERVRA